MSPRLRWTRLTAAILAALAAVGALHAVALLALGGRGAPTLFLLAPLAAAYAVSAARAGWLLRRGRRDGVGRWLGAWAVLALAAVGAVGAAYRPGPLFWASAAGAVAWWALGAWFLARRVRAEAGARDGPDDAPAAAGLAGASRPGALPSPEAHDAAGPPAARAERVGR